VTRRGGPDAHYSPPAIAAAVADQLDLRSIDRPTVIDFAVGQGALLHAVRRRFPNAALHGTDISQATVRLLRETQPAWCVGRCDFLSARSRAASALARAGVCYDAVVLNPPFSYRGGARRKVRLGEAEFEGSPAAAFVSLATSYVEHGEVVAVLPAGSLHSQRDAAIWEVLSDDWQVQTVCDYPRGAFPGLAAATTVVALTRRDCHGPSTQSSIPTTSYRRISVEVTRGCTPMYRVKEADGGFPLVHTTGLGKDELGIQHVAGPRGRTVRGPVVLLPRVGNPTPWKLRVYSDPWPITLSDCVIGLVCNTPNDAEEVIRRVTTAWGSARLAWSGSCAPYLTLERLVAMLDTLGVSAVVDPGATQATRAASGLG
jgi:methylase of polypeptide subunit release factors